MKKRISKKHTRYYKLFNFMKYGFKFEIPFEKYVNYTRFVYINLNETGKIKKLKKLIRMTYKLRQRVDQWYKNICNYKECEVTNGRIMNYKLNVNDRIIGVKNEDVDEDIVDKTGTIIGRMSGDNENIYVVVFDDEINSSNYIYPNSKKNRTTFLYENQIRKIN